MQLRHAGGLLPHETGGSADRGPAGPGARFVQGEAARIHLDPGRPSAWQLAERARRTGLET